MKKEDNQKIWDQQRRVIGNSEKQVEMLIEPELNFIDQ